MQYFEFLVEIFPEDFGNVTKYILGHEAIQNAIAIATNNKIVNNSNNSISFSTNWQEVVEILHFIDWTPNKSIFANHLVDGPKYKYFKDNKHNEILPILQKEWDELLIDLD